MKKSENFELVADFQPTGDQPQAIEQLIEGVAQGKIHQSMLGVTGSGKTFTMANVIARLQKPALILAPNKTLAAQLFSEFKQFFPKNAVEYFVSYYDYYQPEAYIPSTDTYIEKDSAINEEIDQLRHSATRSLLDREDVIIVSSVSCIYGLGSPEAYEGMILYLEEGREVKRQDVLRKLVEIQYQRNDIDFHRGTFRVRGDSVDVFPAYEDEWAVRIEFFGDQIDSIYMLDPLRGVKSKKISRLTIYPASHYVTTQEHRKKAMESIRVELRERLQELERNGKPLEAKRLESRTMFDLEMIEELGYCQGIENYSRHLTGRAPGQAPPTLLEYFPKDFLMFIDESHVTIPQIGGMYRGDRARKTSLVEHGFRLPSALDNRPLNFQEFEASGGSRIYVSATPGEYELQRSNGEIIELIIRPTGLLDPIIEVRPAQKQVEDLLKEIHKVIQSNQRVLVTTLTKKLAEDLTQFYLAAGVKVKYLHSDIETIERIELLRELRAGSIDVLVGINLLREGLDLPEVALVAILDADKEGFLRSTRSLIQTIGRAARNDQGRVILYADHITQSMAAAMEETKRRRALQEEHNRDHGITPRTVQRKVQQSLSFYSSPAAVEKEFPEEVHSSGFEIAVDLIPQGIEKRLGELEQEMRAAAKNLDFERAAKLRDQIKTLRRTEMALLSNSLPSDGA